MVDGPSTAETIETAISARFLPRRRDSEGDANMAPMAEA